MQVKVLIYLVDFDFEDLADERAGDEAFSL